MNYIQRIYDLLVEERKYMLTAAMEKHARKGGRGAVKQVRKQMSQRGGPVVDPAVRAGTSAQRAGIQGSEPLNKSGRPSYRAPIHHARKKR
jgi:hypothetical protein